MDSLKLGDYDISTTTGFVPEQPIPVLTSITFEKWERTAQNLPQLLQSKQLRQTVNELPDTEFSSHTLHSDKEWKRAYAILSFISQGYIWEGGQSDPITDLPAKLAIPWHTTSQYVGVPPAATYAATIYYNYRLKDPSIGLTAENLQAALTFTERKDESWFYMIHLLSELAAVPGLKAIEAGLIAMAKNDDKGLQDSLKGISESVLAMKKTLTQMYDMSDPKFYYNILRYFFGCPDGGVRFTGVSTERKFFRGGSGAQDTAIPAFGVFLGVKHSIEECEQLEDFKKYMPPKHREFLLALQNQPTTREYVQNSSNSELVKCYNEVVEALVSFRTEHRVLVTRYIVNMKHQNKETVTESAKGMGGSSFMVFLRKLKEDTVSLKL